MARGAGIVTAYCLQGYPFNEGISVAATKTDGDDATAAPAKDIIVQLMHRPRASLTAPSVLAPLLSGLRTMKVGGGKESLRVLIGGSDNTAQNDVSGDAGSPSGTLTIYRVRINATQNPAEDVYVRLFDDATPTVGTTDAEMLLPCKKGRDITWDFPRGVPFDTNNYISVATVKDRGATSGNTAPTGIVDVIIDLADVV